MCNLNKYISYYSLVELQIKVGLIMCYKITENCSAIKVSLPIFLGQTRITFSSGVQNKIWGKLFTYIITTLLFTFHDV